MELNESASALGLYKYHCDLPESGLLERFYATVVSLLQSCGITLTYIGADGPGYTDQLTKFGGRAHKRMLKSRFAELTSLSVLANPPQSDSPAYDSFASASLGYVEPNGELLLCLAVNESFIRLHSSEYDGLLRSLVALYHWDFGYGFAARVEKQPDFHILGVDNGKLSAEEYRSLCTWYDANAEVRTAFLRDVYPYNILNDAQLNAQVSEGMSLRQFAQRQPSCSLTRLTDYGLHLWQVPDEEVARLRKALVGSPVLIS